LHNSYFLLHSTIRRNSEPTGETIVIDTATFHLTINALEPLVLPPYKGSTLRGGFGTTFRRVVCGVRDKECAGCMLKGRCVYSYIFETPIPADTEIMRKYEAAPHPFVIEPPPERRRGYEAGEELVFGLTLVGRAIDYLPYFVYTFDELGKSGLGKGRGKFELKSVMSEGKTIYSSEKKRLTVFGKKSLPLDLGPFDSDEGQASSLTLNFLTPTRIAYNGKLTLEMEFHTIARSLLRRISLLSYFHGNHNGGPAFNFKEIIEKATTVRTIDRKLRWYDWERYSGRQEKRINMGGFVGEISFEGDLGPFMPLIKAGEVLHVGKGTVFGLGRYEAKGGQAAPLRKNG
jgi:CRISPR-associated endoribonuclease Cas6